ncbi:MAG: hypothetical protein IPL28_21500 [Chloroflexi bacterium]|nr:hypothetical protein [Chloroflexota bacterium]
MLGHLPLALEHSAAYMLAKGKRRPIICASTRKKAGIVGQNPPPPDYPATVATTWRVSFDAAQRRRAR